MPPVTTAVLWTIAERRQAGEAFGTGEVFVLLLALLSPIVLVAGSSDVPVVPVSLAMLLALIAHRCLRRYSAVALRAAPREA
jgi:hypothetical protein